MVEGVGMVVYPIVKIGDGADDGDGSKCEVLRMIQYM